MLEAAVFAATEGRPGPMLLNLPSDLGTAACGDFLPVRSVRALSDPGRAALQAARGFVQGAQKLLVIAGSDVDRAGATKELIELVESTRAAVLVNMDARGVFPETHPR